MGMLESPGVDTHPQESAPPATVMKPTLLADYGIPESVMERAKIRNILSAMKRVSDEVLFQCFVLTL